MKRSFFVLLLLTLANLSLFAQTKLVHLLCENKADPVGVDQSQPRLTWQLETNKRNVLQTAYEIRVADNVSSMKNGKNLRWNSGKVASDQSVLVPYGGAPLEAGKKYFWQVRVWDNSGKASDWSSPSSWQMGMLKPDDWKAKWITIGYTEDSIQRPSPYFRKSFTAAKKVLSATASITSLGLYEASLNGHRIGNAFLTPGWTSYNKRLQYQVYDVTSLMQTGNNAVGMMLANGWYRGAIGWEANRDAYGKNLALLFQLDITYTDGTKETVVSDGSWKSSTGAIRSAEIYHGERYDAREEKTGWNTASYNDQSWSAVRTMEAPKTTLVATYNEPVIKHEIFTPQRIFRTPKGELVADFGQNLVGLVQLKVRGKRGDQVSISHAEVLDKAGNFYTANLRAARQQNTYILNGGGEEVYEPHFTFQGFRYVKVDGFPGELRPENLTATALYSDMPATGTFTTSNPLLNQLQHNIQWGQRGNFLDVPTDCPQRDERLGWTGDAQVFARTASYNRNVHSFFAKWLRDVAADQSPSGSVPFVIPNVLGPGSGGSAGWADVATVVPWTVYLAYGDRKVLGNQYSSMKAWVGFMQNNSTNDLWNKGFHFGDWLFYRPEDDNDGRSAITDKYLIAQAFYAYSTQLLINAATVLGKQEDVATYSALLQRIKDAFLKEYVTPSGRLVSSSQTAYVLALQFDLLPEALRAQAAERLVQNIRSYNNHLTTGFLGTPYLCHVLSRFGYTDVAYQLLLQETYPSWLYPVKMGATTIWERWDGQKPDSTFQTPGMNSFNHYAYGAIGDWMYRVMAGIDTDPSAPGYKKIVIQPHPTDKITSASADLQTYYGVVSSHWKQDGGTLHFDVEIPANTSATVYIPAKSPEGITEGGQPLSALKEAKLKGIEGKYAVVELGSGRYSFASAE
ncbi:alpha-L-rhamnosidase [Flavisolibacter nicotianae]|uniref:alpha-L-rhamnosidase n=1 Tax=Flavisolibacter nicotianae TaxID=2364882 RepID=UPI000EB4E81C|nr:alpha-L-rhamnosidase [Flavisolibacter nicotianae]